MKVLLIVMAIVEAVAGLGLLVAPAFTSSLLLGMPFDAPNAFVVGRLAGASLLSLAIACWQARDSERGGAATGIVAAMLFYNEAAASLLVYANIRLDLQSGLLWPVIVLHQTFAVCCALNFWFTRRKLQKLKGD